MIGVEAVRNYQRSRPRLGRDLQMADSVFHRRGLLNCDRRGLLGSRFNTPIALYYMQA